MVADSRAQMNKFLYGVSDLVKTECRNAMLLGDMNISRLMTHAQQVEGDKLREHAKETKKARTGNYEYSQQKLCGGNRSQFQQKSSTPVPSLASVPSPRFRNNQKGRASGSKSQGSVSGTKTYLTCPKCSKNHPDECLAELSSVRIHFPVLSGRVCSSFPPYPWLPSTDRRSDHGPCWWSMVHHCNPSPTQHIKSAKSRPTDRPTVRRSDHGPWSMFVDQDSFTQPLTRTTVDQYGPSFDPRSVGLTLDEGQQSVRGELLSGSTSDGHNS
uniref:Gag-pol polyprotein n=1 Tax=Solanum tuberosum TaxID=4113 RepID=M1DCU8_SOLTU